MLPQYLLLPTLYRCDVKVFGVGFLSLEAPSVSFEILSYPLLPVANLIACTVYLRATVDPVPPSHLV